MKRFTLILIVLSMLPSHSNLAHCQGGLQDSVAELSSQIAREMSENNKTTIAIIELSDLQGNVTNLGRFLAEELMTRLYQTKKFRVIERQLLNRVIVEQKLTLSRLVDPASAKKLGKLLGVDAICSGSISELAKSLRINARLINTESGEVFSVAAVEIVKDESVMNLLGVVNVPGNAGTSGVTKKPRPMKSMKISSQGFTFELVSCRRTSETKVVCELLITDDEADQDLSVYAEERRELSGRVLDESGNEYPAFKVQFGNGESRNEVRKPLLSGVGMKATWEFQNIPTDISKLRALDVGLWGRQAFHVKYRDIEIQ